MAGVEALNKRVLTSGIELGRVVDVILDQSGDRPIGYDVLCGDGSHRFLPHPTARIDGDHVEVDSPFVLLEAAQLDFYRERGRALRS